VTKGFRVDPDKLTAVADRVKALHGAVSGDSGNWAGNKPNFTDGAKQEALQKALAEIWPDWQDGFSKGYGYEYSGVLKIYGTMEQQLASLEKACRSTAEQYSKKDDKSTTDVNTRGNTEI